MSAALDQVDVILLWRNNPVRMIEDLFGIQPDKWQAEALQSLVVEDRVAIRSGHGVGKSALMAWAVLWWMLTHYPCKVACTAPTSHQLNDVLWGEIAKWVGLLPESWRNLINVKSDRVELVSNPMESFASARTARKEQPEAFQGFHSENMLFLADEASGIENIIFEVGSGSMSTAGAKTLMAGNPTRTQGYFYDAFNKMRENWHCIQVDCATSKMVSPEWIASMKKQYGEDSDVYRVRVKGDFPRGDDNTVIPLHMIEAAIGREVDPVEGKMIWGVDVARFGGDKSALAKRRKNTLVSPVKTWQGKDLMQTVGIIVREYEETPHADRPDMILVDSIGLGSGVVDRLREQGYPARGINVAESPSVDSDKYSRLRDELWWKAREWLESRDAVLPNQDELIGDLATPTFEILSSGKIKVESKTDIKKRLPRSPDVADAFCLTFAISDRKFTSKPHYRNLGIV
jgi:hypothetical protein